MLKKGICGLWYKHKILLCQPEISKIVGVLKTLKSEQPSNFYFRYIFVVVCVELKEKATFKHQTLL